MDNKKVLNNEDIDHVTGGACSAAIKYIHSNCGGYIECEDAGIYHEDLWMKCPKCGKSWHPHSSSRIDQCEDIYTVVTGTY